jgi:type II secretory pathway component PulM
MTTLSTLIQRVREQMELPRYRHLPKIVILVAVLGIAAMMSWLPTVQSRLAQREIALGDSLRTIQNDIAELERLKSRALPTRLAGAPLKEAIAASLANKRPVMSVELVDAARVRIQGTSDFDSFVRWLGDAQRSHRLGVVSLTVKRTDAGVTVDMTLSASRE